MTLKQWLTGRGMRLQSSRAARRRVVLTLERLESRETPAIVFKSDFDADAQTLFDTNPNLTMALTAATNKYTSTLDATLAAVPGGTTMMYQDPANSPETVQIPASGIGMNDIYIRVRVTPVDNGGHKHMFGAPGFDLAMSRGDVVGAGVLSVNQSILTDPLETLPNLTSGFEHEIGHIFGFVSGEPNFDRWVNKKDPNHPLFIGPNARAAFGNRDVPLDPNPLNFPLHWAPIETLGQLATMQAIVQTELTPLDKAAFIDLGWKPAQQPTPATPATPMTTTITGLADADLQHGPLPPGYNPRPSEATLTLTLPDGKPHAVTFRAGVDTSQDITLSTSVDGGPFSDPPQPIPGQNLPTDEKARGVPALAAFFGQLYLAWTGTDQDGTLQVARVDTSDLKNLKLAANSKHGIPTSNPNPSPTGQEISLASPTLAVLDNALFIAWTGVNNNQINIKFTTNSDGTTGFGDKQTYSDTAESGPTLFSDAQHNNLYVTWDGTDPAHTPQAAFVPLIQPTTGGSTTVTGLVPGDLQPVAGSRPATTLPPGYNPRPSEATLTLTLTDNKPHAVTFRAGVDTSQDITLEYQIGGGTFSGPKAVPGFNLPTDEKARGVPALAAFDGQLYLAWTATDQNGTLQVAQVDTSNLADLKLAAKKPIPTSNPNPSPTGEEISLASPTLAVLDNALFIAWTRVNNNQINIKFTTNSDGTMGFTDKHTYKDTADGGPTLFSDAQHNNLYVTWDGTDPAHTPQAAQVLLNPPSTTESLTFPLDETVTFLGDQAGPGPEDIILARSASGNLLVSLNGTTTDYDAASVHSIVINTGAGQNTVSLLASLPGVPVIINANGQNTVNLGANGLLQGVQGSVTIHAANLHAVALTVDDFNDSTGRVVTIDSPDPATGHVALAGADVFFGSADLDTLTVFTGAGVNTVDLNDPASERNRTDLVLQGSSITDPLGLQLRDTVYVLGTGSHLNVFGQGNGGGATDLTIDDSHDSADTTYTVTASTVQGGGSASISYSGIRRLTIDGGGGSDTFNVQGLSAATPASIIAGSGANTVNVGAPGNALDPILSALTVVGQGGADTLNVNDQGAAGHQEYDVYSDHITREPITSPPTSPTQTIAYAGFANVVVNGSNGGSDVFFALGTPAGTALSLNAGSGGGYNLFEAIDEYNPADTSPGTDNLLGRVAFHGHHSIDSGVRYDYYDGAGHTFTFSAAGAVSTLQRDGAADLTYDGLIQMVVYVPKVGGNQLNVKSVAPGVFMNLTVSAGDQAVVGSLAPSLGGTTAAVLGTVAFTDEVAGVTSAVTVDDSGDTSTAARRVTVAPPPDPNNIDSSVIGLSGAAGLGVYWHLNPGSSVALRGGAGAETFALQGALPDVALSIDAGGGSNTLDYSAWVGDVSVNLQLGTATGVAGGISNIQNATGSIGNDILVGDANANVLVGGTGRNLIIGGGGPDQLFGGSGDNILIGGTTADDQNLTALLAIMQEFERTDLNFHQRVNDIMTGTGLNGPYVLNTDPTLGPVTVFDDGAADVLNAGGALDWFFVHKKQDVIVNRRPGDKITLV
jgi:hypothetical protein